jgi:penicillin-insensitive murein DD-endopeptidase
MPAGAVRGLNSSATRVIAGATSFSNCTHLPPISGSKLLKPVMLPPGRDRLATKPSPTGSATTAKTIGMVAVARLSAAITGVLLAMMLLMRAVVCLLAVLFLAAASSAVAQEKHLIDRMLPGSLNPRPLPPLKNPDALSTPAKELFARKLTPFPGPPRSIGGDFDGCLAGAVSLPITGPTWQVMRPSRNRNWGNPQLIRFIERFATNAKKVGWNGLLVGDMSQPRGGPMLSEHTSHQIGLDVDIWFAPMPDHVQSREEREFGSATDVVAPDLRDVDPKVWTHRHTALIRTAAQDPVVVRILVNAAIKKALCREAGADRTWLYKVRPWYGHAEHFHVQLACPADSAECKPPAPPLPSDGCGSELDFWFKESTLHPPPRKPKRF